MRVGDEVRFGDVIVCINDISNKRCRLAIKARKSTKITRIPAKT